MTDEPETADAGEATRRQVLEIVAELPFEDDASTFGAVMLDLARVHALDDEA